MIAVTCRNGEHFTFDPDTVERIETDPDTVVHLLDGTKYVVDQGFDELLRIIRDHRAANVAASMQLTRTAVRPRPAAGRPRTTTPVAVLPPSTED